MSGYNGEKSLEYYLKFFPDKQYHIFKNLRLLDPLTNTFFEIDTLLVSNTLILELDAKSHKGELHFDHHFDQMHQTYDDNKITYACPLLQLRRHEVQLRRFLETNKIPVPPIESLVVITNPSTRLTATSNHPGIHKIINSPTLLPKKELLEKKHKKVVLEHKQIQKLSRLFKKLHTPYDKNILKRFSIEKGELLKGVFCPKCGFLPMDRTPRQWRCTNCGHVSKTAHLQAIVDYGLLIDSKITNKELRDFLLLPSRMAATHIFKTLRLECTGNTKGREYLLGSILEQEDE
ncbi:NERD domain-containing protein [Fredinandcohnia sp. 179-A 10B2 NHS]|uniref:NERD domain-containing protein n=1 Tax=Fredinandcohnia sp. 179-A 10B2 NHS TaxID=3235176 RepID=UPI0039A31600